MKEINIIKDEQTGTYTFTNFQEIKTNLEEVLEGFKDKIYTDPEDAASDKKVLDEYLKVMFDEQDRDKASTYVDNSCYYLAALSENNRKRFIEATEELQEEIITLSDG